MFIADIKPFLTMRLTISNTMTGDREASVAQVCCVYVEQRTCYETKTKVNVSGHRR